MLHQLSLFAFLAIGALAAPIDLSKTQSKVEFLAIGKPAVLKIRGKLPDGVNVLGNFAYEKGTFSGTAELPLEKLDTGITLRNEHMTQKYLEVAKFPKATLRLKPIAWASEATEFSGPFQGMLSLHGIEKEISGTAMLRASDNKFAGKLAFAVTLSDFAIEIPQYMGITVSKTVEVEASFQQ